MAQLSEKHGLGRIEDREVRERSESLGNAEDFFLKKRDKTKKGEREKEGRAFQGSKKTSRSPINTKDEEITKKVCKELKYEIKRIMKEIRGVKEWKIAMEELKEQRKYIREELEGVKKDIREGRLNRIEKKEMAGRIMELEKNEGEREKKGKR